MAKSLGGSVGRMGGRNFPFDVIAVQQMLNQVPPAHGGPIPKLVVDGICGPQTIDRIQKFQIAHFGWSGADGRVDPNGPTHTKLNEFDDKAFPAPTPLTTQPQMACPHFGRVIVTQTSPRIVVLQRGDNFIIAGCYSRATVTQRLGPAPRTATPGPLRPHPGRPRLAQTRAGPGSSSRRYQHRLPQFGQDRFAQRISRRDKLREEIAHVLERQVMRSQLALERRPVLHLAPG
jgi:hypothetical protein